jgi:hypothetical protein
MENNRQYPKIVNRLSGWVEVSRDSKERVEVAGITIGPSGIEVISPKQIEIDEEVTLILNFFDHQVGNVSECLQATVMWVKPIKDHFEIGLKFISLDQNNQALVFSYMKSRKEGFHDCT